MILFSSLLYLSQPPRHPLTSQASTIADPQSLVIFFQASTLTAFGGNFFQASTIAALTGHLFYPTSHQSPPVIFLLPALAAVDADLGGEDSSCIKKLCTFSQWS